MIQVIRQGDASEMPGDHDRQGRSWFQVDVDADRLAATPQREFSYFEWSIVTDPTEIDGERSVQTGSNQFSSVQFTPPFARTVN